MGKCDVSSVVRIAIWFLVPFATPDSVGIASPGFVAKTRTRTSFGILGGPVSYVILDWELPFAWIWRTSWNWHKRPPSGMLPRDPVQVYPNRLQES